MLSQTHSLSLRQIPTAHLAQTMSLLALGWDELRQKIENELASNPALEISDIIICPSCHRHINSSGTCMFCKNRKDGSIDKPIVFISSNSDYFPLSRSKEIQDNSIIDTVEEKENLTVFVLKQIGPELQHEDRVIATYILNSLNDDGLLEIPITEIANYFHVPISRIQNIIEKIQHADPIGVGSKNPQQALIVQLDSLAETSEIPAFTKKIINESLDLLGRRAFLELSKKYHISIQEIEKISNFIADNLNPFPARAYWGENLSSVNNASYYIPDIIVSRQNNEPDTPLVIEILSPYSGNLRVNPIFKQAFLQAPNEKVDEWQKSLESAILLIKCLQQRNQALVRLVQRLAVLQREFFLKGDAYLLPITRAQIADELGVHESTISRAVSEKTVQLPNRKIIPLSKLFDRSLQIRTTLKNIINNEPQPLSDTQLAKILRQQGFPVARRTVAKYRMMEGILSARYRQVQSG